VISGKVTSGHNVCHGCASMTSTADDTDYFVFIPRAERHRTQLVNPPQNPQKRATMEVQVLLSPKEAIHD